VRRFKARTALALVALLVPIYSAHADLIVPTGSLYTNSGAQTDLGCTDVVVAGTLTVDTGSLINIRHLTIQAGGTIAGGSGEIQLGGNWSNGGTFTPAPRRSGSTTFAV
jgi:hypothetical protein